MRRRACKVPCMNRQGASSTLNEGYVRTNNCYSAVRCRVCFALLFVCGFDAHELCAGRGLLGFSVFGLKGPRLHHFFNDHDVSVIVVYSFSSLVSATADLVVIHRTCAYTVLFKWLKICLNGVLEGRCRRSILEKGLEVLAEIRCASSLHEDLISTREKIAKLLYLPVRGKERQRELKRRGERQRQRRRQGQRQRQRQRLTEI